MARCFILPSIGKQLKCGKIEVFDNLDNTYCKSEIALFGAIIEDETGKIITNEVAGIGGRNKPLNTQKAFPNIGQYGAISAVTLEK